MQDIGLPANFHERFKKQFDGGVRTHAFDEYLNVGAGRVLSGKAQKRIGYHRKQTNNVIRDWNAVARRSQALGQGGEKKQEQNTLGPSNRCRTRKRSSDKPWPA